LTEIEMECAIAVIAGLDGYWSDECEQVYQSAAQVLVHHGLSRRRAVELLTGLYWAAVLRGGDEL
jgi:hypothetical protein